MESQNPLKLFLSFLVLTLAFIYLFHVDGFGLNMLIYSVLVLIFCRYVQGFKRNSKQDLIVQAGYLLSALLLVLHNNSWALFVNICFGTALVGRMVSTHVRSLIHSLILGLHAYFFSYGKMFRSWSQFRMGSFSFAKVFRTLRVIIVPTLIIGVFLMIYGIASPGFAHFLSYFDRLVKWLVKILEFIDIQFFFLLVLGVFFHTALVYFSPSKWLLDSDKNGEDVLVRRRTKSSIKRKNLDLLVEYKAGLYLMFVLNCMLLIVNYFDVQNVWFKFSWEGQYLKQYVHNGAGMLLFSILISVIIVLYFFRGNLNFYKKNRTLKLLSSIWLIQNAILTLSLAARVAQYIAHYNLAYYRIALMFFLLLTFFGIATVWVKVNRGKSSYYLLKTNAWAWAVVMLFTTLFDWNGIIARYNIQNHKRAFTHFEFLYRLPDACLDDMNISVDEVETIDDTRYLPAKRKKRSRTYMTAKQFNGLMYERRNRFLKEYPNRSWRSWNYAEHKAYQRVKNEENTP